LSLHKSYAFVLLGADNLCLRVEVCYESTAGLFAVLLQELPGLEYLTGVVFGNLSGLDFAGSLDIRTRAMQIFLNSRRWVLACGDWVGQRFMVGRLV
jgi:hypothetical protein